MTIKGNSDPLAVIVGMTAEARIARRLGWPVATGGGTAAGAEAAARRMAAEGARGLVSFGLAGGLDPVLRPGRLIVPVAVVADGRDVRTDPGVAMRLGGATPHRLIGADAIAVTAAEKRLLWERTGAVAVDLESGAVARVAVALGLRFAVLRAICDPAERDLPAAALAALDQRGVVGIARVVRAVLAEPGQVPALLALARDAAAARRALVGRVGEVGGR